MRNRRRPTTMIVIGLLLTLLLTGCWNRHELDTLSILLGVGIDKSERAGEMRLTAQVVRADVLKNPTGGNGGSGSEKAYWNTQSQGTTVLEAMRGFTHETSRRLYVQHNQVLIFSRNVAQDGVGKYIDFFVRDHESRLNVWVLIADGKASDILEVKPELERTPAQNIANLVKDQAANSQSSIVNLKSFLERLMGGSVAPIAPLIKVKTSNGQKSLVVSGTAVFKQDKLVGELNQMETRGLMWAVDDVHSGIIVADCPSHDGKVSLEIGQSASKISPRLQDGSIRMLIKVKTQSNISDQSCAQNLTLPAAMAALRKQQSELIREEVLAAWDKAREYQADLFGFGELIHERHPRQWKRLRQDWERQLPRVAVDVQVETVLRMSGKISEPVDFEAKERLHEN